MKNIVEKYIYLFSIAGVIVMLDQWTKNIVRTNLALGETWLPQWLEWLGPYARFVHWYNTGAAFGMFQSGSSIFMVLAIVVVGAIIYYFPQVEKSDWTLRLAMSMQLSGATGNLLDRIQYDGQVTDFISVGTFPVFNVADASITVGTAILLLGVYLQERTERRKALNREVVSEGAGEA